MPKLLAALVILSFLLSECKAFLSTISPSHISHRHQHLFSSSTRGTNTATKTSTSLFASPRDLVIRGMQRFREGDIESSINLFNEADKSVPDGSLRPFLWQRGISYYYADQFAEGSEQFRFDVSVNPLDVEEIVWDIACLSRLSPTEFPPPNMMSLPKGKSDRRKIMSSVYALFRGEGTEWDLYKAGSNTNAKDEFYSLFYLGLFCEARGEMMKAENYMRASATTSYAMGAGSGDYMSGVAKVHCKLRGWV